MDLDLALLYLWCSILDEMKMFTRVIFGIQFFNFEEAVSSIGWSSLESVNLKCMHNLWNVISQAISFVSLPKL